MIKTYENMNRRRCCGNCIHFKIEDAKEIGFCEERHWVTICSNVCKFHKHYFDGWAEITPDNVDSIYDEVIKRVIVTDGNEYKPVLDWHCGLSTMAKIGGYYYSILPELKNDGTE